MRIFFSVLAAPLAALSLAAAETPRLPTVDDLVGEWQVDLRPTPDADDNFQPMVLSVDASGEWSGTFYGSPIEDVLVNDDWSRPVIAFVTRDAVNTYYHSGEITFAPLEVGADGEVTSTVWLIRGRSYVPTRNFLAVWTAVPVGTPD